MPPKLMGRPPTGGPVKRIINVRLDLRVAEGLRAHGHGNMPVGVALAAEKAGKTIAAGGLGSTSGRAQCVGSANQGRLGEKRRPENGVGWSITI